VREFIERWRIFFSDEIGAHAIPNDENDVARICSRRDCHHRAGLTQQSRDYDEKEFSEVGFQQRDLRLKNVSCHPERSRGIPLRRLKGNFPGIPLNPAAAGLGDDVVLAR
jgi:hypothetical protein